MSIQAEQYVQERLQDQIEWYSRKSSLNKKYYYVLKFCILAFSTAIPVISGFLDFSDTAARVIAGVLGSLIALLTGAISLFKFQEKWTHYRTTSETLKHHKYLFLTHTHPYTSESKAFQTLVNHVEAVISSENSEWDQVVNKMEDKKEN